MFKKIITALFLIAGFSKTICMEEQAAEVIPYYENIPHELIDKIIKEYLRSSISSLNVPTGKNSLMQFSNSFKSIIKRARLINRTTNNLVAHSKSYAVALLVQKFNTLSESQKIDCFLLSLRRNKSLASIILLSFLDISKMDVEILSTYIKPHFKLLNRKFKKKEIVVSKDNNFLLYPQSLTSNELKLLLEIQKNLSNYLLFDTYAWFVIAFSHYNKGFLKTLLENYDYIKEFFPPSLIIEAATGDIDGINQLTNKKQHTKFYGLTAVHWAIIGNPPNLREVLDILLSDEDLTTLPLNYLQLMLRLATNWSDEIIIEYILSRFQNNLPYEVFIEIMDNEYQSTFPWDQLNTPLAHAIICPKNEHYENIILTLINYGADLNCIRNIDFPQKSKSILVNTFLAHKKNISRVIEELDWIKETDADQPFTIENILEACDRASKPKIVLIKPVPSTNYLSNQPTVALSGMPKRTNSNHQKSTLIATPAANAIASNQSSSTNKHKTGYNTAKNIIPTIKKSKNTNNYAKIGLAMGITAIGAYICYRMIKNNSNQKSIDKFRGLQLNHLAK